MVIACNTASALALPLLKTHAPVPLLGVIQPGAEAAAAVVRRGSTALVLATEATVASHAYVDACAGMGLKAVEKACPLFVPLVEEGWTGYGTGSDVAMQVADIYLREALALAAEPPSAVVLGCTHYPLLRLLLQRAVEQHMGRGVPIVDSAEATARQAARLLPHAAGPSPGPPALNFLATDSPAKFQRLGARFLGRDLSLVEHVALED